MRRQFFNGACAVLVANQGDIDFSSALRARIEHLPIALIGASVAPATSLLQSTGAVFDRFFSTSAPDAQAKGGDIARTAAELDAIVKSSFGPLLAIFVFDDRPEASADWINAFKRMRIPVYLVQREAVVGADAFGIWQVRGKEGEPLWGHTRPTRVALQSPRLVISATAGAGKLPRDEFGVNGINELLYGHVPYRVSFEPSPVANEVPSLLAIELGLLPLAELEQLKTYAADENVVLVEFDPNSTVEQLPSAPTRILVSASTAEGAKAVGAGWKVVVLDTNAPNYDDGTSPFLSCASGNGIAGAVVAMMGRRTQPGWAIPAELRSRQSDILMIEVLGQEIVERYTRGASRAKAPVPSYLAQVNGLKPYDAISTLRFPLFELERVDGTFEVPSFRRIVCISHDWSDRTGLARPAKYFLAAMSALGVANITFQMSGAASAESLLRELRTDDFVLFNSIGIFERSDAIFDVYDKVGPRNRAIYLHETDFTMDRFAEIQPERHERFKAIAPDAPLLCVSNKQAGLFQRRYGAKKTFAVYNTTSLSTVAGDDAKPDRTYITMSGTVQRRKGVELFSRVADLALQRGLDWRFQWIGHETEEARTLYMSRNVDWLGRLDGADLTNAMRRINTLFLSSMDDPFPLSTLEALQLGKRVVVYTATGIEEVITGVPGCAVYHDYTPESALDALMTAIGQEVDPAAHRAVEEAVFSLRTFVNATTRAMEKIRTGEPRKQSEEPTVRPLLTAAQAVGVA